MINYKMSGVGNRHWQVQSREQSWQTGVIRENFVRWEGRERWVRLEEAERAQLKPTLIKIF